MQLICDDCASTSQPTRLCEACGEVEGCRHNMRKARVRNGNEEWREVIACLDPFGCVLRHAKRIMK